MTAEPPTGGGGSSHKEISYQTDVSTPSQMNARAELGDYMRHFWDASPTEELVLGYIAVIGTPAVIIFYTVWGVIILRRKYLKRG